jgi:alpha-beta hydrolase superfamily lysophospholipase
MDEHADSGTERHGPPDFALGAAGGVALAGRSWPARQAQRGVVALIHGHGEHSGRYNHFAEDLNRRGFSVLAIDLRGHGRSGGKRGEILSYDVLMEDIALLMAYIQKSAPRSPRFLYGHSMGGNLVLNFALRRRPRLSGLIASSPLLRMAVSPARWKLLVAKGLRPLLPRLALASGLNDEDLSRDASVVAAYRADPLVHDRVTARFLDVLAAGEWALGHAAQLSMPLLLMHGEADRITSARASLEFAARSGRECEIKLWRSLYHEIHHEPERADVLAYLTGWMEDRLGS